MFTKIQLRSPIIASLIIGSIFVSIGLKLHHDKELLLYQTEVAQSNNYIYNSIKRDVILGGRMASSWDLLSSTETVGDTLLVRFSSIDSVRYFRTQDGIVYRENVPIANGIELFKIRKDSLGTIDITVVIVAVNTSMLMIKQYRQYFKWAIIPRVVSYR